MIVPGYEVKDLLDHKYLEYNNKRFIETDPVYIPHQFSSIEDIEIAGFFSAILAWGQRVTIIKNGLKLMNLMDNEPFEFVKNANEKDCNCLNNFVHRTFNGVDCTFFVKSLGNFYRNHKSIGTFFENNFYQTNSIPECIKLFRKELFNHEPPGHASKHIADIEKNATAKRLNMYLRWMIRKDKAGVDFGLWNIPTSALYIPLDVHSASTARKLGLLTRRQNDWNAVIELTQALRQFDSNDPIKYDFALFGLGVFEKF